jgi:hypothetical protein
VIGSAPTGSEDVVTEAVLPLTVAVPIVVPFVVNVTVPVAPEGTVAVIVTVCPYVDGFGEELTVTVVAFWLIVSTMLAVAELLFASPP